MTAHHVRIALAFVVGMTSSSEQYVKFNEQAVVRAAHEKARLRQWSDVYKKAADIGWPVWCSK